MTRGCFLDHSPRNQKHKKACLIDYVTMGFMSDIALCIWYRDYLRLGNPLCCKALDELLTPAADADSKPLPVEAGAAIPVNRVRCIVSMTTPRDVNLHGLAITPPFVELNMGYEGFGCLYIPSIAPQGPPNPSVVGVTGSTDVSIVGGVGTGKRNHLVSTKPV